MNKLVTQSKGLQPQIIQDWTPENKKIVQAYFDRKIATFFDAEDKNEQFQNLHKLIVKWAVLTGVKPLPTDDEIRMLVEYIAEHFYRFSLMEIDNAFSLATAGKLDIEADHYQSFSVIYISKIINAYKRYNGKYIIDYRNEIAALERKAAEPNEEEKIKMLIENILEGFDNFKEEPKYNHFGYIAYDFLSKLGVIDIDKETKAIILEQARKMAVEDIREKKLKEKQKHLKTEFANQIEDILNDASGKQDKVIRICKNLGLLHYYEFILENNLSLEEEITKKMNNE
jgi:hypothetical protein|tara:strand:- start:16322 stop:17176 length:855 start_codon:yes stop_codon:yes gene_type:complete